MNGDLQGDGKGKALGALTGITVSDDGKIYGSYDNGKMCIRDRKKTLSLTVNIR